MMIGGKRLLIFHLAGSLTSGELKVLCQACLSCGRISLPCCQETEVAHRDALSVCTLPKHKTNAEGETHDVQRDTFECVTCVWNRAAVQGPLIALRLGVSPHSPKPMSGSHLQVDGCLECILMKLRRGMVVVQLAGHEAHVGEGHKLPPLVGDPAVGIMVGHGFLQEGCGLLRQGLATLEGRPCTGKGGVSGRSLWKSRLVMNSSQKCVLRIDTDLQKTHVHHLTASSVLPYLPWRDRRWP